MYFYFLCSLYLRIRSCLPSSVYFPLLLRLAGSDLTISKGFDLSYYDSDPLKVANRQNILASDLSISNRQKELRRNIYVWIIKFVDLKSTNISTRQICRFQIDKKNFDEFLIYEGGRYPNRSLSKIIIRLPFLYFLSYSSILFSVCSYRLIAFAFNRISSSVVGIVFLLSSSDLAAIQPTTTPAVNLNMLC